MRAQTLLAAALTVLPVLAASPNIELYPNSEDCTGEKIVITLNTCQNVEIRGSAKVISGGTWGFAGKDCTSLATGVFLPQHGCFITYPVFFSWLPTNR